MKAFLFALFLTVALLLVIRRRGARIDGAAAKLRGWQRGECEFDLFADPVSKEDRL